MYSETSVTTYEMPETQMFALVITTYNAELGSDPFRLESKTLVFMLVGSNRFSQG